MAMFVNEYNNLTYDLYLWTYVSHDIDTFFFNWRATDL